MLQFFGVNEDIESPDSLISHVQTQDGLDAIIPIGNDPWLTVNHMDLNCQVRWLFLENAQYQSSDPIWSVNRPDGSRDLTAAIRPRGYIFGQQRHQAIHVAFKAGPNKSFQQPLMLLKGNVETRALCAVGLSSA